MKTQLVTRKGYIALQQEQDRLWRKERPEITKKVAWAASLGDRSENADYQYNKKKLREIDRRIRYLRKCLANLQVVDYHPDQEGKVFFGARVSLYRESDDKSMVLRIVGYDEIFAQKNLISVDSPMARAMLGKAVDDSFEVTTEHGKSIWLIEEIHYDSDDKL